MIPLDPLPTVTASRYDTIDRDNSFTFKARARDKESQGRAGTWLRKTTWVCAAGVVILIGWAGGTLPVRWLVVTVAVMGIVTVALVFQRFTRVLEVCILADLFIRLMVHVGWSPNEPYVHPGVPITVPAIALILLYGRLLVVKRGMRTNAGTPVCVLIGILVSFAMASVAWAPHADPVIHGVFLLLQGAITFHYFSSSIRGSDDITFVTATICILVGVGSIVAIAQYLTGSSLGLEALKGGELWRDDLGRGLVVMRVSGLGGTPNELARSIVVWLPLGVVFGFMKTTKRWLRVIALGSVATGAAALCVTASRGGMLTAVLTALAGLAIYAFSRPLRARIGFLWRRAVLATLFLVVLVLAGAQGMVLRLVNDDNGQAASRWTMIQVATVLIADNPIGGVGLNSYVLEMNRYDNSDFKITEIFYYPVHNLYLLLAGELGGVGLICYVMIFIALLSYATKALGSLRIQHAAFGFSVLLALIAFGLYGLIEGDTLGSRAFMHFWVAGACAAALRTPAIGRKRSAALATSMPNPSRHPDLYHSLP